ncbi:TPM domain-containing protein, partial [bacterium]|nr:TPM domain-containing protein [bacterium]
MDQNKEQQTDMRHNPRGLLAAFMLMVGFLALWPARAMAYDCTSTVVDDAGVLGTGIGKVQASAAKLESAGAYVRVRTVNDFGGFADADRYEMDYEANCQAWQDMNGGTKSNLLVLVVSFGSQRGAGLYYGDLWKKALDANWNTVLTDEVVPRLRDGDSAAAL